MSDLSSLSTEQLLALKKQKESNGNISSLPTEQLLSMREQLLNKKEEQPQAKPEGEESLLDQGLRQNARLGRAIATGLSGILDIPNLPALGAYALGMKEKPYFYEPISGRVQNAIDESTKGSLKPRNKAEEWVDTGVEALSGFLIPGGATSAAARKAAQQTGKLLSKETAKRVTSGVKEKNVKQVAAPFLESGKRLPSAMLAPFERTKQNVGIALGSSGAAKYYADNNDDAGVLPLLGAGVLGGVAGKAAASPIKTYKGVRDFPYMEKVAKGIKFNPEKFRQAKKMGLSPDLSMVSDSPFIKYGQKALGHLWATADKTNENIQHNLGKIKQNFGINPLAESQTYETFPYHVAKEGAQGYKNRVNQIVESRKNIYGPELEEAKQTGKAIDVKPVVNEASSLIGPLQSDTAKSIANKSPAGITKRNLEGAMPEKPSDKDIRKHLKSEGYTDEVIDQVIDKMTKANSTEQTIPYNDFKKFKNDLQNRIGSLEQGTPEYREATALLKQMTAVEDTFTESLSPAADKSHKQMKRFYSSYANEANPENMKQYVEKLLAIDSDPQAFNTMLSSGKNNKKHIDVVMNGTPKNQRADLTNAIVAKLGQKGTDFNIMSLHSNFEGLPTETKMAILRGKTPHQQRLFMENMKLVGDLKKDIQKYSNTSGTAPSKHYIESALGAGTALASALTGNPLPLLAFAAGNYAVPKAASKLFLSQSFQTKLYRALKKSPAAQKERAIQAFVSDPLYKKVMKYQAAPIERRQEETRKRNSLKG